MAGVSRSALAAAAWMIACAGASAALADDAPPAPATPPPADSDTLPWALHGQFTAVEMAHPAFRSPFRGPNSLDPGARGNETTDATLYAGVRLSPGTEVWINPEVDQGFGLSNTLGAAAFPSGEAYKVGKSTPYLRLQRLFLRQTFNLGGDSKAVDGDINVMAGQQSADRLVFTVGKFSVTDVFDTNKYAHDPRGDFLNWALLDTATFDYAADAWGYSAGASAEWYKDNWAVRAGLFDLSIVPNSTKLDPRFAQFQYEFEIERDFGPDDRQGKLKLTSYLSRGNMGTYADAIALGLAAGQTPSTGLVRKYASRTGVSLNLEQPLTDELGLFARAGWSQGDKETYEFTDVDRTAAVGLSMNAKRWGRPDDTIGVAGLVDGISKIHQQYLADGGLGVLIGDGRLPHPGNEAALETYYSYAATKHVKLSADYQLLVNPAYDRDRGPVSVFSLRLHAQY
jgi:high affinity Mn2+ porin